MLLANHFSASGCQRPHAGLRLAPHSVLQRWQPPDHVRVRVCSGTGAWGRTWMALMTVILVHLLQVLLHRAGLHLEHVLVRRPQLQRLQLLGEPAHSQRPGQPVPVKDHGIAYPHCLGPDTTQTPCCQQQSQQPHTSCSRSRRRARSGADLKVCSSAGWTTRALAVVEALLCEQARGGKGLLRMIRPGRLGAQFLRELLHLHQVALHAREALCILCAQPGAVAACVREGVGWGK